VTASLVHDWFGWPDGAVLTNLIASAICVAFGMWRAVKWLRRIHHHAEQAASHAKKASEDARAAHAHALAARNKAASTHAKVLALHRRIEGGE
jgi:ABC-type nickel/cobalt efflux system permease component RcnA